MGTTSTLLKDLKDENNFVLGQLYQEHFEVIHRSVSKNNGNSKDVEGIFQLLLQ